MTEKNLSIEEWLSQGSSIIKGRKIHYVHKDKSSTTNWLFENGSLWEPISLLHRNRKSSNFSPNLNAIQARSRKRDEFNSLYSKMAGMDIEVLDNIVENRKSTKCKCDQKYPIVDLIDRESSDHVFICSNCKGTILSRKLKKQR